MKRILMALVACAGAALVFTGCETAPPPMDHGAYLPVNVAVNDLENRTSLVLLSQEVQDYVTCPGIQETTLPDGRLQVAAHVRNRSPRRVQVQANCEFKDAQGFVVDATPFESVILTENAQEDVRFVSANDKAKQYTIRIRDVH